MRNTLIFIVLMILFSVPAIAGWVPAAVEEVHEGEQLNVKGLVVLVKEVDPDEGLVWVKIRRGGEVLGEGVVFEGEEMQIRDLLKISIDSFSPRLYYGRQATLRFQVNAQAKILFTNFPNHLNYNDRYPVFAVIANTGATDMEFAIELTEPGNFKRKGRVYQTDSHQVISELLKVDRPIKLVTIASGESKRVNWLIGPNRRQSSYSDSIVKVGDVSFNLWAGNELLDSFTLYSVKASTEQSGYIAELYVPLVMIKDVPYEGYAVVQNSGHTYGGVNSRKFGLRVAHPQFTMDQGEIYDDINPWTKDEWGFNLRAYKPGDYQVKFEFVLFDPFTHTETILDTFTVPIQVLDGFSTRIAEVTLPDEVSLGDNFLLGIVIENVGEARQLDLVVDAPVLTEISQKRRLSLPTNGLVPVSYTLEATTYGKIPITLTLYEKKGSKENINLDPYTNGRVIEKKTVYLNIPNPRAKMSEPVVVPQVIRNEVVVPTPSVTPAAAPVAAVVAREPTSSKDYLPDTLSVEKTPERNWTYIGILIAAILAVLGIFITVIAREIKKR